MYACGHDDPGDVYPIEPPLPGIQGPDGCQDQPVAHAKLNQVQGRRLILACRHDGLGLPASGVRNEQQTRSPRWLWTRARLLVAPYGMEGLLGFRSWSDAFSF